MRREPDATPEDELEDDDSEVAEIEVFEEGGASWLGGFLVGLTIGGLVGAGVMLLAAPERGDVMRRRIRRRVRSLGEEARDHLDELGDEASHQIARQRRRIRRRLHRRH
jgi:YtxH-like protein